MSMSFDKAPLIEIIAELHWNPLHRQPQSGAQAANAVAFAIGSSKLEEFFMRFGGEVYQHGFQLSERLVPAGFPIQMYQPVYRYRTTGNPSSELMQVGAGLFSANAVPPYKSWEQFSPIVEKGISSLLKVRPDSEKDVPFNSVSLRYIDAFTGDFLQGKTPEAFITDVLGFKVNVPGAVSNVLAANMTMTPFVQLIIPAKPGLQMTTSIGVGTANNAPGAIMDTIVSCNANVNASLVDVMAVLNSARSIIHDMFVDLTKPLHPMMGPKGG